MTRFFQSSGFSGDKIPFYFYTPSFFSKTFMLRGDKETPVDAVGGAGDGEGGTEGGLGGEGRGGGGGKGVVSRSGAPHAPNTACSSGGGGSNTLLPVYHVHVSTTSAHRHRRSPPEPKTHSAS